MAEINPTIDENAIHTPSTLKEFWQIFSSHRGALMGLIFLSLILLCTLFASNLAPYDPLEQFRDHMLTPPSWVEGGSSHFFLGTDEIGRDMLSRLIYGGRWAFLVGFSSVALSLIPSIFIGLVAAFFPKILGSFIMRIADIMMALPTFLLALVIVAILGPGIFNAIIAITLGSIPGYVRLIRGMAIGEINKEYVLSARTTGASIWRLMFLTVFPNCFTPILISAVSGIAGATLTGAALSFVGLGIPPPTPDWGAMLFGARDYIESAWWLITMPSIVIVFLVLSINLIGDGLRDALDPKLQRNH